MNNQYDELERMHRIMDEMFNRGLVARPTRELGVGQPKQVVAAQRVRIPLTHITQNEKEVIARIEIPGIEKEDIDLHIAEDYLELKTIKKIEKEQKRKEGYSATQSIMQFYKREALPSPVVADKAHAEYKNGVLIVTIPKLKQHEHKTKKIEVK
jgi:HSP20 family protein